MRSHPLTTSFLCLCSHVPTFNTTQIKYYSLCNCATVFLLQAHQTPKIQKCFAYLNFYRRRTYKQHLTLTKSLFCSQTRVIQDMHVSRSPGVLLMACVHVHSPSLLWPQLFKPEHTASAAEHHPPTPAATALHCLPLTSFQSHIWLVCSLPCLNILSHQSSASVLFVILK